MYILGCADGSYYTGSTRNLWRRVWQHQNGFGANHTRKHGPVELLYYEEYRHVAQAYKREKQIQKWTRNKKRALIEGRLDDLHELAKCTNKTSATYGSATFDSAPFDSAQVAED